MSNSDAICWIITDGRRGMENQCLGIAERVASHIPGMSIVTKRIAPRAPWKWLPESIFGRPWPLPFVALGPGGDTLEAPWPDLVVACGRLTVACSAAIKKASGGRTLVVQTQDPRLNPRFFDLVVPPRHDNLDGNNVMSILGSPNRITPEKLAEGAAALHHLYIDLPRPLVAVLIGGTSGRFTLDLDAMDALAEQLDALAAQGFGLMISTSRRTGTAQEALLRAKLKRPNIRIWSGDEPNPYFAMLGLADHILVTQESTNMVTEAAATGKPVHIIGLKGHSRKFEAFHEDMRQAGVTRPFEGTLDTWTYEPLDETGRVARVIAEKLKK